jgi:hypothetical protein
VLVAEPLDISERKLSLADPSKANQYYRAEGLQAPALQAMQRAILQRDPALSRRAGQLSRIRHVPAGAVEASEAWQDAPPVEFGRQAEVDELWEQRAQGLLAGLDQRRAEVDQHEQQRNQALLRLQYEGGVAYRALREAGHTSGKIAHGLGVVAATARKLNTDGERATWRPLSREFYAGFDTYTLRWLDRSWRLAQLRDTYDEVTQELRAAEERLRLAAARLDLAAADGEVEVDAVRPRPADRATVAVDRTVLVVVHSLTTATRLLHVASLFASDLRVQLVFTRAPDDFGEGVDAFLEGLGANTVSRQAAVSDPAFDIAIAASLGELHKLRIPIVTLAEGVTYKPLPRRPGDPPIKEVYGFDRARLIRDSRLVPTRIALSHAHQRELLAQSCPEALPATVVVGDPCADRIIAALPVIEVLLGHRHLPTAAVTEGMRRALAAGSVNPKVPPSAAIDSFSRPAAGWSARNFRAPTVRRRPTAAIHSNHAKVRHARTITARNEQSVTPRLLRL